QVLLLHFDVESLENLRLCDHTIYNLFNSSKCLKMFCIRFRIGKIFNTFPEFIIEYNHRRRRHLSFSDDQDKHLLWACENGDLETVDSILAEYTLKRERIGDKTLYQIYFCLGCNRDEEISWRLKASNIRDVQI